MTMEPTPPRKPKRPNAFYEKSVEGVKTAAEIVSEAKEELMRQTRDKVRTLQTTRPYTPRDEQRNLFNRSARYDHRPASSFSLGPQHFDSSESRPVSGTRLTPIEPTKLSAEGSVAAPKPPLDPSRKRITRASLLHHQHSLESEQSVKARSGSCGDLKQVDGQVVGSRRVHSGPKERTSPTLDSADAQQSLNNLSLEERGEGDGQEVPSHLRPCRLSADQRHRNDACSSPDTYYNTHIAPVIEALSSHDVPDGSIAEQANELYILLEQGNLLGKACSQRSGILRTVFKIMDRKDPLVLLSLARVVLALQVSGTNLTSACKLVFKVSKNKENDHLFMSTNILELLLASMASMDPSVAPEALIYSCGAFKFLAGNKNLAQTLSQKPTLLTIASILEKVNKQNLEASRVTEQTVQILVQLTSALRRLAEQDIFTSQFNLCHILDHLCVTSVAFSKEYDVMINISSAFSKLTMHKSCCEQLSRHPSCYKSLVKLLRTYTHKEELVLRICYVLGNLAALSEEARLSLYREDQSLDALTAVFDHYLDLDIKRGENTKGEKSIQDVLIKLIRVIANMSISEEVGVAVCDNRRCVEYLLHVIDVKDISTSEELVLNAMATINNLTYFSSPGTTMEDHELDLAKCLMKMLLNDHKEGMVETCRIYGNLTRSRKVRDFLSGNSVLEIMVTLLDSGDREFVYCCCGVLVNFMCDDEKRPVLKQEGGLLKLAEVLRDFSTTDWQLAGLVCQVLWNFSARIKSTNQTFGDQVAQTLVNILSLILEDPRLPAANGKNGEYIAYLRETWYSEFCPVATQLRKRILSHQSQFEELDSPS